MWPPTSPDEATTIESLFYLWIEEVILNSLKFFEGTKYLEVEIESIQDLKVEELDESSFEEIVKSYVTTTSLM